MKKIILTLCLLGCVLSATACGDSSNTNSSSESSIVTEATTEAETTTTAEADTTTTTATTEAVVTETEVITTEEETEAQTETVEESEEAETEEKLVFDKYGISIYYLGLERDEYHDNDAVKLRVENNSGSDLSMCYYGCMVNGEPAKDFGYWVPFEGDVFETEIPDLLDDGVHIESFSFQLEAFKDEFLESGQPVGTPELLFEKEDITVLP